MNKKNKLRSVVKAIIDLVRVTPQDQKEILTKIQILAWELKPLIEGEDSGMDPALGHELWIYIGLQRDANSEMANDYGKFIDEIFERTCPPWV